MATTITAAALPHRVRRDNFCGTQFHPERSGVVARILANFLKASPSHKMILVPPSCVQAVVFACSRAISTLKRATTSSRTNCIARWARTGCTSSTSTARMASSPTAALQSCGWLPQRALDIEVGGGMRSQAADQPAARHGSRHRSVPAVIQPKSKAGSARRMRSLAFDIRHDAQDVPRVLTRWTQNAD